MKILFLSKISPFPVDTASKYKTLTILKLISQKNKVDFVSLVDQKEDLKYQPKLHHICRRVALYPLPIRNSVHKKLLIKYFLSLFSSKPFNIYKYYSAKRARQIRDTVKRTVYDLIYLDDLQMFQYLPDNLADRTIYDSQDIHSLTYESFAKQTANWFLKLINSLESFKFRKYEKKTLLKFKHIFTVSWEDRQQLIKRGLPSKKVNLLPVPFDTSRLYSFKTNKMTITYIGLLSWYPNKQGIDWFIGYVYPLVRQEIKNIRLDIIGRYGENLLWPNDHSLFYRGYISDLQDIYRNSSVVIVPILSGSGIKFKLLEALSFGLPVVSTSQGVHGVPVVPQRDILVADSANDFAQSVIRILTDRHTAEKLSRNGIKFIKKYFHEDLTIKVLGKFGLT